MIKTSKLRKVLICLIILASIQFIYQATSYSAKIQVETIPNRTDEKILRVIKERTKEQVVDAAGQFKYDFASKYPDLLDCSIKEYDKWANNGNELVVNVDNDLFAKPATNQTQNLRIVRGILVYFPIESIDHFEGEFRWLYRSWIEMQKTEPAKWRTDIVVFVRNKTDVFKNPDFFLNKLDCKFENKRRSSTDKPMCVLIAYTPIRDRDISRHDLSLSRIKQQFVNFEEDTFNYNYLLEDFDVFQRKLPISQSYQPKRVHSYNMEIEKDLNFFYYFLKKKLITYEYADSILMAFDGFEYFKEAGYNFLIRSDMDVFLTPFFGKWTPKYCNDFYVGNGGYSTTFNFKRIKRSARDVGFQFADIWNLGSTWYSTPEQFRLASFLTLFSMAYLSEEEFTQLEREGKLNSFNWPDWHYGVLLLYGQNLAMNHLIATRQLHIVKLDELLDVSSTYLVDINTVLHIHVYHHDDMFSKFQFKSGAYDNLTNMTWSEDTGFARYYSLKMALESRWLDIDELKNMLDAQKDSKI